MLVDQRRQQLLELVRSRGFASLPELAEELQVSESTVRRDLDIWKRAERPSGPTAGCFMPARRPSCPHFDEREPAQWDKKKLIAQRAVELIEDGDTLLLDGGSTTYEVARLLVGRPLQVVTNSLPVANLFAANKNSDLVLARRLRLSPDRRRPGALCQRNAGSAQRAAHGAERGGAQRARLLQQQLAAGRNRAGDDASRPRK